jgi:hypothetical protein
MKHILGRLVALAILATPMFAQTWTQITPDYNGGYRFYRYGH